MSRQATLKKSEVKFLHSSFSFLPIHKLHFFRVKFYKVLIESASLARAAGLHLAEGFCCTVADMCHGGAEVAFAHVDVAVGVDERSAELACLCRHREEVRERTGLHGNEVGVDAGGHMVALCGFLLAVLAGTSDVLHEDGAGEVGNAADAAELRFVAGCPLVVAVILRVAIHLHFHGSLALADKPCHSDARLAVLNPCAVGDDGDESHAGQVAEAAHDVFPTWMLGRFATGDAHYEGLRLSAEVEYLRESLFCHVLPLRIAVLHTVRTVHVAAVGDLD